MNIFVHGGTGLSLLKFLRVAPSIRKTDSNTRSKTAPILSVSVCLTIRLSVMSILPWKYCPMSHGGTDPGVHDWLKRAVENLLRGMFRLI